jgi:hypothetical protein
MGMAMISLTICWITPSWALSSFMLPRSISIVTRRSMSILADPRLYRFPSRRRA